MALPDYNSAVAHSFGLDIDGITIKAIMEVSGLKMEQDVIELKQNTADGKYGIAKLPGRHKGAEITATRGLTDDQSFTKWISDCQAGNMSNGRKNMAVVAYDYQGAELTRWQLINAWASKLEISPMKAGDTSVLTEKITITAERLEAG